MKRSIFYLFFIVMSFSKGYCQNANVPISYPKPSTVWEFEKYGTVPVNEYRGLANINLPLYTIEQDNIELPLVLNYYSGGIKVSEEASMVGLGWNLNLPTIIQEVKDKVDYDKSVTHQKLPPFQGNPALPDSGQMLISTTCGTCTNPLNQYYELPEFNEMPFFKNVIEAKVIDHSGFYNQNWKYKEMFEPSSRIIDTEPDIFTVTLNGVEIKFCRKQSQKEFISNDPFEVLDVIIINGRTEYKVDLIISDVQFDSILTLAVSGFKITDPNGNRYFFEKIEKVNNVGTGGSGGPTHFFYKLTKIISNLNKEINFSYSLSNYIVEDNLVSTKYAKIIDTSTTTGLGEVNFFSSIIGSPLYCGAGNSTESYCVFNSTIHQNIYYLNSITTSNESILFNYDSRLDNETKKKLSSIEIKNMFNDKVKKYNFNYDYFLSTDGSGTKRLKLLSLVEEGKNPYIFEYNSVQLPSRNSFSVDYWGYYNGHNNLNFKPDLTDLGYPQYTENISNNFNSNLTFSKACALEKIIYPTKGYSLFEYELHQFDNLLFESGGNTPVINIGAGIRVKSVSNYDFDILKNKTSYQYVNGKSIVKRTMTKQVSDRSFNSSTGNVQYHTMINNLIIHSSGNFINNAPNSENSYIGYDKVIIKQIGIENNGKIERIFSNTSNLAINPYNIFAYNAMNYNLISNIENGKLLEETIYDSQNVMKVKKKMNYFNHSFKSSGFYGISKQSNGFGMTYIVSNVGGGSYNQYYYHPRILATFYAITGKTSLLKSEEITEFHNGLSKTITTNYNYDSYKNISDKITQEYNANFSDRNIINENNVYMFYNRPTYKRIDQNNVTKSILKYSYNQIDQYNYQLAKIETFPNGNLNLNESVLYIDLYDSNNNIVQHHNKNDITICTIWGYNKSLPIAKIENVDYNQIQAFVGEIQNASNSNNESNLLSALSTFRNSINAQFPNALITTYTHKPLIGVNTITDYRGDKVTYIYDSYGKLLFIKDKDNNILNEFEYNFRQ